MMTPKQKSMTTEAIRAGDCNGVVPEFARCRSLYVLFGLKRGSVYNLLSDNKIRGVLLRVKGKKSGIRLFDVASVRDYIRSQMEVTDNTSKASNNPRPET